LTAAVEAVSHVGLSSRVPTGVIFPFTPPERYGMRNTYEFQMLMYRPLY